MPTERLSMRDTREILRQKWQLGRSHRAIAESLGVSAGVVGLAMRRAVDAGLKWEAVEAIDDVELERRLYPAVVAASQRPGPDCVWIHRERHRVGVTLELLHHEYLENHPDGLKYTAFCERYREWLTRRGLVMRQVHVAGDKLRRLLRECDSRGGTAMVASRRRAPARSAPARGPTATWTRS